MIPLGPWRPSLAHQITGLDSLGCFCTADKSGCGCQVQVCRWSRVTGRLIQFPCSKFPPPQYLLRLLSRASSIKMMEKSMHDDVSGGKVSPQLSNDAAYTTQTDYPAPKAPLMTRLGLTPESFKRRTLADKHNQLNQTLKGRHLSMIAIGGSIGAGLFVGSGGALRTGGPAALLIAFGLMGVVSIRASLYPR
jgi:hypothetical protein